MSDSQAPAAPVNTGRRYDRSVRARARALRRKGHSLSDIARSLQVNRETATRWCSGLQAQTRAIIQQRVRQEVQQSPAVAGLVAEAAQTLKSLSRAAAREADALAEEAGTPASPQDRHARARSWSLYHEGTRKDLGFDTPGQSRPLTAITFTKHTIVVEGLGESLPPDAEIVDAEEA